MLRKIDLHFEKNNFGLFAVEEKLTKQFIGFTGFTIPTFESFFMPCVEIGWRFKKDLWGKCFATQAANARLKYGFDNLHFEKIVSFTSLLNRNSERVMQRIGMKYLSNFDHTKLEKESLLCSDVLYEIIKEQYEGFNK
jgi:RimJ/RimL family protein N-acetyltransferase